MTSVPVLAVLVTWYDLQVPIWHSPMDVPCCPRTHPVWTEIRIQEAEGAEMASLREGGTAVPGCWSTPVLFWTLSAFNSAAAPAHLGLGTYSDFWSIFLLTHMKQKDGVTGNKGYKRKGRALVITAASQGGRRQLFPPGLHVQLPAPTGESQSSKAQLHGDGDSSQNKSKHLSLPVLLLVALVFICLF